jgi:hypothetical protein
MRFDFPSDRPEENSSCGAKYIWTGFIPAATGMVCFTFFKEGLMKSTIHSPSLSGGYTGV